ncbi:helix-turn-helix transcriptional regulator [Paenibacillaceae sp. P-4]|uniref:helix-turn-helix domain-containing protein n=1 Tax=Paenibacillaceae bacterium P-4 TaxID=3160969 RepID=UPI0032E822D1
MALSENMRAIRKEKGLTQHELAELANLSRSYIADVERKRYNPSFESIQAIANALGVKVSKLIGESTEDIDKEDWTQEEIEEITKFKEFIKSKRKKQ